MTTTVDTECTYINIESDLFHDDNTILTLTVTHNCTTTYDEIDLLDAGIGTGDAYDLNRESLGLDDPEGVLPDGVYYLLITQTDDDSNVVTESKCVLVDCSLTCNMTEVFTDLNGDPENIIKALSYHALKIADSSCSNCSCTDWCTLYNTATETECEDDAPCGCN